MKTFEGSMTALATPFRDGRLDEDAYRALIEPAARRRHRGAGAHGHHRRGRDHDRRRARPGDAASCVEEAKGRVPVVAGAGSNSTAETIEAVGRVREVGADGALIVTPYYNKPTQAGPAASTTAPSRKAHPGFPLVAYNVPGRTGVDLLPETVQRLCEHARGRRAQGGHGEHDPRGRPAARSAATG